MASRKGVNIYILKYFTLHRYFCFLRIRGTVRLCWPVSIAAKYVTAGNLNTIMNPSSYKF